jgi:membrane protein DedA with SNARE-associated domain
MESFIIHVGYAALMLLAFLEACCIPISSELIFMYAGVLAGQGHLNLVLVIVLGAIAEMAGSYVSYTIGRLAKRSVVERLGRFVLIGRSDLDRAEHFLAGRGGWAVPVGRVLPLIRSFVSLAAGIARVPAGRFGVLSLIGTVIYVSAVSSIGYSLGSTWTKVEKDLSDAGYAIGVLVVLVIAAFIVLRVRALRREDAEEAEQGGSVQTSLGHLDEGVQAEPRGQHGQPTGRHQRDRRRH